jgi:hypothetical protein
MKGKGVNERKGNASEGKGGIGWSDSGSIQFGDFDGIGVGDSVLKL